MLQNMHVKVKMSACPPIGRPRQPCLQALPSAQFPRACALCACVIYKHTGSLRRFEHLLVHRCLHAASTRAQFCPQWRLLLASGRPWLPGEWVAHVSHLLRNHACLRNTWTPLHKSATNLHSLTKSATQPRKSNAASILLFACIRSSR